MSNKRVLSTLILILTILIVLFFTFQKPERSRDLSETVRTWLSSVGINVDYKTLRSNIHIPEYFIVGLAVCNFCRLRGWKIWPGIILACVIGILDESVKILLPGREFDAVDMIKDWLGVLVAAIIVFLIKSERRPNNG